jgi:formate dehydrogenase subunit gamma
MTWSNLRQILGTLAIALVVAYGAAAGLTGSLVLDSPAQAQTSGAVPGNWSGNVSDTELWRAIRKGAEGTVTLSDKKAGVLVQSEGESWRNFKNGPLSQLGGWSMLGILLALALFRVMRGQVKVDSGLSGKTIERFNGLERATHWLTASSFILLAVTGLNIMYGRYFLSPILGPDAFASLTYYGKITHNYIAFAFILGIVMMLVLWVKDNIFDSTDIGWITAGGGLFAKGVHPPAKKFNFGQKCVFWLVILGGGSLAWSGVALLFPYEITPWGETFAILNVVGFGLPTDLTPLQEVQISVLWHGLMAVIMIAAIIAHIYIGTPVGMEGAIGAVGQGQVDINWAREHHSLWVAELEGDGGGKQPAE